MATKTETFNLYRYLSVAIVAVAFTGLFWGRVIQQNFPFSIIQSVILLGISFTIFCKFTPLLKLLSLQIFSKEGIFAALALYLLCAIGIYLYVRLKIETAHFFQFSLLSATALFAWAAEQERIDSKSAVFAAIAAAIFSMSIGSTEEYLQVYVPDRFFDWGDIAINCSSAALGATLGYLSLAKKQF